MKRLAIISPNKEKYSETFIHKHVRELPGEVHLLHGGYMPTKASLRFGEDVEIVGGLGRYLEEKKIEVVLAEYGPSGLAAAGDCARLGIPLYVHFHGYDAYRADILGEQGLRYPEMFAKARGLIVVSADMRRQLNSLGAPAEKIHLLPYGIDPQAFAAVQPDIKSGYILALGRMVDKKGPRITLKAFARMAGDHPQLRMKMVGEGPLLDSCRSLADRLGLSDRIEFPGAVTHEEVPALMAGACMFAQHSLRPASGDSEGLPLAILEAMAAGLPIVATTHAGIPDAVRNGTEGYLVAEGDLNGMARRMDVLRRAHAVGERMGARGRERVAEQFTAERYLGGLVALLGL